MTPAERRAVHALAGAFSRLSLAAELARLDAGQLPALDRVRKVALADFAVAMDALAAQPATPPPMSSAPPSAPPPPAEPPSPPPRAAQTPAPSTTPRLPADAGSGRAVPERKPTMAATALELAAQAPFTALDLARATGCDIRSCEAACSKLKAAGQLVLQRATQGVRGTYTLPGAAPCAEPAAAPAKRVQPTARSVTTPASSVRLNPRAQGPVAGQHAKAADFYADKPRLPPARAPQVQERGARHG